MTYEDIKKIQELFESGNPVKLSFGNKDCFVKVISVTQFKARAVYRISLENDDLTVETGLVKWETIFENTKWSSVNSVDFTIED